MSKSNGIVSRRTETSKRLLRAAVMATPAVAAALALAPRARAANLYWDTNGNVANTVTTPADGTWDNATTANWTTDQTGASTTGNWVSGSTAFFAAGPTTAVATPTAAVNVTEAISGVSGISFGTFGTFTIGGTGSLALTNGTIATNNSAIQQNINVALSGSAGVTKTGAGSILLGGANTFTGGVTVSSGGLNVNDDTNLGDTSNSLTLAAGTFVVSLGANSNYSATRALNLTGNASFIVTGTGLATWNGSVSGTGALTKSNTGSLTLTGAYSNVSGITASGGTLVLSGTDTHGGGTSISGSATVTVTNTNALHGAVTVGAGTLSVTPGSADNFTFGDLTLNANSRTAIDLGAPGTGDKLNVANFTVGGAAGLNVSDLGSFGLGTYSLVGYTGTFTGNVNNLFVNTGPSGFDYTFTNDTANKLIKLNVGTAPASSANGTWNVDADGTWGNTANWLGGAVPGGVDSVANFTNAITADRNVVFSSARTLGTINFNDDNQYTISGGAPMTMQVTTGSAGINLSQGSATISTPVTLNSATTLNVAANSNLFITSIVSGTSAMTKTGAGQLIFTAQRSNTGGVTVSAGSVRGSLANFPNVASISTGANGYIRDTATGTFSGVVTGVGTLNIESTVGGASPIFTISANNTMTGAVNISGGQVVSLGATSGAFSGASSIIVGRASTLTLNNATNNTNRVGNSTQITLNGGMFQFQSHATSASTETLGALNLGTGGTDWLNMNVNSNGGALIAHTAASVVTFGSLNRTAGSTLMVRGTNVGGTATLETVKFTTAPTLSGGGGTAGSPTYGLLRGVYIDTQDPTSAGTRSTLATYDATNGIRRLDPSEYTANITSGSAVLQNIAPVTDQSVTADTTINAIEFGGAGDAAAVAGNNVSIATGKTLTLNSGVIFNQSSSPSTITGGTLAFGGTGEAIINVHANSAASNANSLRIDSTIQGSQLTKEGNNDLILGGTNNFTGVTNINRGRVVVTQNSQLGSAVVVGNSGVAPNFGSAYNFGGQLQLTGNVSYSIPLTLGGATTSTTNQTAQGALDNGGGNNTWAGNITLTGQDVNAGNRLLNTIGSRSGGLTVSGVISSSFMTTGTSNTGLDFTGEGTGYVVLTGPSKNTYDGLTRLTGGTIIVEKNGAFGTINPLGVDDNVIMNGSTQNTIAFRGGVNYSDQEWIFTNGGNDPSGSSALGLGNLGVLASIGGNNTFAGGIGFGAAGSASSGLSRITVTTGSLTLSGQLAQQSTLNTRTIDKEGSGELVITGDNINTPLVQTFAVPFSAGAKLVINGGGVTLGGSNPTGGNLPNAFDGVTIGTGARLTLDNSLAVNTARLNPAATVTLAGGEIALIGNSGATVSQSFGSTSNAGFSTLTVAPNGQDTTLTLPTITRTNRGTLLLRGIDGSHGKIALNGTLVGLGGGAGSTTISILPEAVGDASATGAGTDFVTISGGIARVLASTEYAPLTSGSQVQNNTVVNSNITITGDTAPNSVKINGKTVTINNGFSLLPVAGAVLGLGTSTIAGAGTLNFNVTDNSTIPPSVAPVEGIITVPTGSNLTISSTVAGDLGITKSGGGVLTLSGTNTFGSSDPTNGVTTINGGSLQFSSDSNLGNSAASIVLAGGTLAPTATTSSARAIRLGSLGTNAINVGSGAQFTASGLIDDALATGAALTKTGPGELVLTNATNSYTGGTNVNGGLVSISADHQMGTGAANLNGGDIHVTATGSYTTAVNVNNSGQGFDIDPAVEASWSGNVAGAGQVKIYGGGTFFAVPPTPAFYTHSGSWLVTGGSTLKYAQANALSTISSLTPNHWTLDNGRLLTLGQSAGGILTYSGNRGITLLSGGGTVEAQQGSATGTYLLTFPTNIQGTGALKLVTDANSIIALGSASTYSGGTNVTSGSTVRLTAAGTTLGTGAVQNDGTLQVRSASVTTAGISGAGTTDVGDGTVASGITASFYRQGTLKVNALSTATIAPSGGLNSSTSKVATLTLAANGKLDIKDNKLIVTTAGQTGSWTGSAYTGLTGQVALGYNGGLWDGAGGIKTSIAGASDYTSVGIATGADVRGLSGSGTDTFGGQTVHAGDTVVMYTYGGDANLDGLINIDDYTQIDSSVSVGGALKGWYNGDFNYDGEVNIDDYTIIDSNLGIQGTPFENAGGLSSAASASGSLSGVSAVPEPASVSLLALGALSLLGRRSRRQK